MTTYINLIISTIITVSTGILIRKYLEKINPLTFSYLAATRGKITHSDISGLDKSLYINTHTLIITNPNERLVNDVRVINYFPIELSNVGHNGIRDIITVLPVRDYEIKKSQNNLNVEEIFFSKLIPKESIIITYMYPANVNFSQFNINVYSDDGAAKLVPYAPQKIYPTWLSALLWILIAIGSIVIVNFILNLIPAINYLLQKTNNLYN